MVKARGRPQTYKPAFCDKIIALAGEGKTKEQWAAACGVSTAMIYAWADVADKRSHDDFIDAFTQADAVLKDYWINLAKDHISDYHAKGGEGRHTNQNILKLFMANIVDWRDKREDNVNHEGLTIQVAADAEAMK